MKKSINIKEKQGISVIVKAILLYGSPLPCKRHHALYTYITKPRSYTYKNHYRTLGGKSICLHARKETSDIEQTSDRL